MGKIVFRVGKNQTSKKNSAQLAAAAIPYAKPWFSKKESTERLDGFVNAVAKYSPK